MNTITIHAPDPDSFEYLIGYIEKFDFHDPSTKAIFDPHPIVGRVYQVLKDNNGYVLHLGDLAKNTTLKGIFLGDNLITSDPKWDFEVALVNRENMLDLDITSEDIQKVGEWLDSNHKVLKDSLAVKKKSKNPKVEDLLPQTIQSLLIDENKRTSQYNELSHDLSVLVKQDPEILSALCLVVSYLSHKSPSLTLRSYIASSKAPEAVVAAAMASLESYDETAEPVNIFKTIETCLYEVQKYS